jgi:hypothetical protein
MAEVRRMLVVRGKVAPHLEQLPDTECDLCWETGFSRGCAVTECARRMREQLEAQIFGWRRLPVPTAPREGQEGNDPGEVAVIRMGKDLHDPCCVGTLTP